MKPVLQALLLADHVYQDKDTGKKIIAGTFNRFRFKLKKQPAEEPDGGETAPPQRKRIVQAEEFVHTGSHNVYINLTEVRGKVPLVLRYVSLRDNRVLIQCGLEVSSNDPLQTVEVVLPFPRLPARAGVHALELLYNDDPMGALRIAVEEAPEEEN